MIGNANSARTGTLMAVGSMTLVQLGLALSVPLFGQIGPLGAVWMRLAWAAVILVVAAYLRGRIYTAVKHPMLAGVKLWAFGHLLANGDLGGIILFASVLAWAVYDRITLKHRGDPGAPPIPVGGGKNDIIAIIVGTIVYLALGFVFHPVVIGVPAFGP